MKLSVKFLKDYVDVPVDYLELAEEMTSKGNEYESASKLISATDLVIGKIIECSNHPDSDHLKVCKVDIKKSILNIVCGAPNAREGIKVIVAKVGAILPEITIKRSNIRGIESEGMMCSLNELGLDHKFLKLEDVEGIAELDESALVGEDPISFLGLDDEVIDFELTSNRGDLLSVLGMAYEVGAIYSKSVKDIALKYSEIKEDFDFNLDVQTDGCSLFLVKKVKDITIKESPAFIKNRLIASGIRPINNVVDISNYVMLETGQPLHYYDASKLEDTIVVRQAYEDERLVTLDNNERVLSKEDIVIANKESAIGLAGVMGGLSTEIDKNTKDIIIESAIFDPIKIRKTSKKILRSEASNRFEKKIDPNRTYMAIERSCALLEKYADAKIVAGIKEYSKESLEDTLIDITFSIINKVLGLKISNEEIINIFERLGFKVLVKDDNMQVSIPKRRVDISIKEDLIEEVGRMYGVDNIEGKLPVVPTRPGHVDKTNRIIRDKMIDLGLNETLSYTLIAESNVHKYTNDTFEHIKILDPMTEDRTTLRYSLIPSLVSIYEYNKARSLKDICIFEIGKGFYKIEDDYKEDYRVSALMTGLYYTELGHDGYVDFYVIKGVVEELLDYLGYKNRYSFVAKDTPLELHPGQSASIVVSGRTVGYIGKVHPSEVKDDVYVFEIKLKDLLEIKTGKMKYKEISKYPNIVKDVAFILDKEIKSEEVISVIKKTGGKLLTNISVFDLYEISEEEKSLAFSLTFSDFNKTLTDEEVTEIFNKVISDVEGKLKAKLRK
ncbi:MAG: phenylalanine--tRNA ligase subunit beta [Bacilli bacterium]|nr:phenylalanine--tRNA ligase subunit beta [Bacilli bacterium]